MITNKELQATKLSATNKDYYQVWNELLDTASKLSERWDPMSTNEGDPGIVLLKVLTAIADKLSYNIDKNILEAFMPSAAQAESMRALCDMMGYNIKYYRSATTNVVFSYTKTDEDSEDLPAGGLTIPMFTVIQNNDKDIFYVTTECKDISQNEPVVEIPVTEGQLVKCESDSDNLITLNQIDDYNRYYLPEVQIAENGIFIFDVEDGETSTGTTWEKVDNLNAKENGKRYWKFGFDSNEGKPYIQFPDDIAQLIKDGLEIYYLRTSGVNGNVSARVLTSFETPSTEAWETYSDSANFTVVNPNAATTGSNPESLTQAYNGFKKTVGTFDTLVTCRDYMNKIYQLVDENDKAVVSNIIVTDIRDDINRAKTICEFNDYGICYKEVANKVGTADAIDKFDLVLYPFKTYSNLGTKADYDASFDYDPNNYNYIQALLKDIKTLSHVYKLPQPDDIVCIKNYLKLDAIITTTTRVNAAEQAAILTNIKTAIYNTFNMRNIDFGEQIPFDSIMECIEGADPRIKDVSMYEPDLVTVFVKEDGTPLEFTSTYKTEQQTSTAKSPDYIAAEEIYNKLTLANILAGKICLFNYDTTFKSDFDEGGATALYPAADHVIGKIKTECELPVSEGKVGALGENEVIKLRSPNYVTETTYPAYVNYFFKKHTNSSDESNAVAAEFITVYEKMNSDYTYTPDDGTETTVKHWEYMFNKNTDYVNYLKEESNFSEIKVEDQDVILYKDADEKYKCTKIEQENVDKYYYGTIKGNANLYTAVNSYLKAVRNAERGTDPEVEAGFFDIIGFSLSYPQNGRYIANYTKYRNINNYNATLDAKTSLFYCNKAGKDAVTTYVPKDTAYKLQEGDFLCINYTKASTSDDGSSTNGEGDIKNKAYDYKSDEPIYIRANFNLKDSISEHNNSSKSWRKTEGYAFDGHQNEVPGMFSLDASEQIEIIKEAKATITGTSYLYWILTNGDQDIKEGHGDCHISNDGKELTYTLQDGEYLFYTDENKLDMAYYGSGTVIRVVAKGGKIGSLNPEGLHKTRTTETASIDDILTSGIANIPWEVFNFSSKEAVASSHNNVDFLECIEYNYITLTKGATVEGLTTENAPDKLTNDWASIPAGTTVTYTANSETKSIVIIDDSWKIRSCLELNVGPTITQTIGEHDKITIYTYELKKEDGKIERDADGNYLLNTDTEDTTAITADNSKSLKTSALFQSALDTTTAAQQTWDTTLEKFVTTYPVKVKTFDKTAITLNGGEAKLNNMEGTWTRVALAELASEGSTAGFNINVNIPEVSSDNPANFGLMMIYYTRGSTEETQPAYITGVNTGAEPVIYNYCGNTYGHGNKAYLKDINDFAWWDGLSGNNEYKLKPGLNVVVFKKSTPVKFMAVGADKNDYIIFSELDILNRTNFGIDVATLDYRAKSGNDIFDASMTDSGKAASTLLKDINDVVGNENQFYYNTVLDNKSLIDINYVTAGTDAGKKLSSPYMWYDYNNVCNKFVISEIDSGYLSQGIKIANASKAR